MTDTKQAIRQRQRQQRRQLTTDGQHRAAEQLAALISRQSWFERAHRMAFYLASDGELDPAPLMAQAQSAGKITCLPFLDPVHHDRMHFLPWRQGETLVPNRYGIPEPDLHLTHACPAWTLDVVFLPLVAFDRQGHRLGMGGGFYDRTFARLRRARGNAPLLVGVAHSFQEEDNLPNEPWDVPLHAIATERELITISPNPT